MKHLRLFSLSMAMLVGSILLAAQSINAQTQPLKFNTDGKFKIVQFTDIHWVYNSDNSKPARERMIEVLDAEKPDLVVLTGDVVTSKPAEKGLKEALAPIVERKIPFALTFGNHDDENDLSRKELFAILQGMEGNLTTTTEGITGVTNYLLPIKASADDRAAAVLYVFDSNSYSTIKGVKGYGWIEHDQVGWYKKSSAAFTAANGGTPLPALAFFHIPIPEYHEAVQTESNFMIGTRKERACSGEINSGLGTAMLAAGDVMATFVGHDHVNDYAVNWRGILLCYGRLTGGNTTYNDIPQGNGARVIELTEGKREFQSWIRLKDGVVINHVNYPADINKR
ncbi:MAG: metallophosphoesterase family protein [Alistipes sp.]|nr:metallophosphoesterase family protein [Alistipes sp.]